jgi:hypothetical protein
MPVEGGTTPVLEGTAAPAQEHVALGVALVLEVGVELGGEWARVVVDLNGVVDDEVGLLERVHLLRVAAELGQRLTHGREIRHCGDTREVLHQDTGGVERDLVLRRLLGSSRARSGCALSSYAAVFLAEQVLNKIFIDQGSRFAGTSLRAR